MKIKDLEVTPVGNSGGVVKIKQCLGSVIINKINMFGLTKSFIKVKR